MFFFPEEPKLLKITLQKTKLTPEELRYILIGGCKENLTSVRDCDLSKKIHQGQYIEIINICDRFIQQQKIRNEWRRQVHLKEHRNHQSRALPSAHIFKG